MADIQDTTSPHLPGDKNSPLEALVMRALARFGEMSPSTTEGEAMLVFLDYANEIIDDVLAHPYTVAGTLIPYYDHVSEAREVPDHIVVAGLLCRYAKDQGSKKADRYESAYYMKLGQVLARVRFGVGAEFELQAVDYITSAKNGAAVA